MSNTIFLKQYLLCVILAIAATLSIYIIDKRSTSLFTFIVLLIYMPSPLYATIVFDKGYLKSQVVQMKNISLKKYSSMFFTTILLFWMLIFINLLLYYILKHFVPTNIIGLLSFDNDDIYKNILNLLPSEISLPNPEFKSNNGVSLFFVLLIIASFIGAFINSVFALTEEIGWRGSFMKNLKLKSNVFKQIVLGAFWGIWHSPLIIAFGYNYPDLTPIYGILLMIIFCVSLHLLFITINYNTVIESSIFHGCINASPIIYLLFHSNYHNAFSLVCGVIPIFSIFIIYLIYKKIIAWKTTR